MFCDVLLKAITRNDINLSLTMWVSKVAVTVCSMISFLVNRRSNGLQLHNAMTFLVLEYGHCAVKTIGSFIRRRSTVSG